MHDENTFRWILAGGFAALVLIGGYHRIRSHTGEPLDRSQEKSCFLPLRLFGLVWFVGGIAYLIQPGWMAWSSLPLPAWLRWSGAGLGVVALLLTTWTFHHLGRNLTDTVVTRRVHALVTSGPYRYVRHPFYSSFFLSVLAVSLVMANWLFLLSGCLAVLLLVLRTRIEERHLLVRFGDDYRDYMQTTGRFVPRVRPRLAQQGARHESTGTD